MDVDQKENKKDAKKPKNETEEEEISEEDKQLKENLELMVERAQDADPAVQKLAIESISKEIRTATSSMTSVPKPLKFLRSHYDTLKSLHEDMPSSSSNRIALADVVSVLAMTSSTEGSRDTLKFRLKGSQDDLGSWGHEYIRHLAGLLGVAGQA